MTDLHDQAYENMRDLEALISHEQRDIDRLTDEREAFLRELEKRGEEPPHAATKDPRPDPRTHPEFWTE